jgi:hypothetical protein
MTRDETSNLIRATGDLMQVVKDADLADKAEICGETTSLA